MKTKIEDAQAGETPALRFGVVADMHVTTPASCAMTEKAFRYLKARGTMGVRLFVRLFVGCQAIVALKILTYLVVCHATFKWRTT